MSDQATAPDTERLAALKAKLAAREGLPAYKSNVEALKAEIARVEKA